MAKVKKVRQVEIPSPVLLLMPGGKPAQRENGEPHLMDAGEFMDAYPLSSAEAFGAGPKALRRVLAVGAMFEGAQTGARINMELDDYDKTMEALGKIVFRSTWLAKQLLPFIAMLEDAEVVELPKAPAIEAPAPAAE